MRAAFDPGHRKRGGQGGRRVLFVSSWYPSPSDPLKGLFVQAHAQAANFYQDVGVLAATSESGARRPRIDRRSDVALPTWHVRLPGLPGPLQRLRLGFEIITLMVVGLVVARRFRPQLIHANTYETALVGGVLGRLLRVPVVATEHYGGFTSRRLSPARAALARVGYRLVDRALPVSADLAAAMVSYGIRTPMTTVPNAVDTATFSPGPERPRDDVPKNHIVFVGRVSRAKGVDVLLDALFQIADTPWDLSLVGAEEPATGFRATAEELGIGDRVQFLGVLDQSSISELLRDAALLVLPSRGENLPCVVLEALCSGAPVVVSRVGGLPEVVEANNGILVPPGDAPALARAIAEALATNFDRNAIAARASDSFSLQAVAQQLTRVYDEVSGVSH